MKDKLIEILYFLIFILLLILIATVTGELIKYELEKEQLENKTEIILNEE